MYSASAERVNELLLNWGRGDAAAREELIPLVYEELRRIARRYLWKERPDHHFQSVDLVNEAYLRLIQSRVPQWQNRAHFFGVASQLMRRILVEHARARLTAKRGAGAQRLTLTPLIEIPHRREIELLALNDALKGLAALDPKQRRLIELRFFGGLSIQETAAVLRVSPATVKRTWTAARKWLKRELNPKGVQA